MKLAFIVFLLFVGTMSIQTPSSAAACIRDIKADVGLVQQLITDAESKNIVKIMSDLLMGKSLLEKTQVDCQKIQTSDILAYLSTQLTREERECVASVVSTIKIAQKVAAEINKDWSSAIVAASELMITLINTKSKCTAATLKIIAK